MLHSHRTALRCHVSTHVGSGCKSICPALQSSFHAPATYALYDATPRERIIASTSASEGAVSFASGAAVATRRLGASAICDDKGKHPPSMLYRGCAHLTPWLALNSPWNLNRHQFRPGLVTPPSLPLLNHLRTVTTTQQLRHSTWAMPLALPASHTASAKASSIMASVMFIISDCFANCRMVACIFCGFIAALLLAMTCAALPMVSAIATPAAMV